MDHVGREYRIDQADAESGRRSEVDHQPGPRRGVVPGGVVVIDADGGHQRYAVVLRAWVYSALTFLESGPEVVSIQGTFCLYSFAYLAKSDLVCSLLFWTFPPFSLSPLFVSVLR